MSDTKTQPKPDRVRIENVNHPGASTSVDAAMYKAMREALLEVLPASAPGMTETQMRQAVLAKLSADLFPGGARAGWWSKAVQLDLEAKGVIQRETSRPLRWHHPAEGSGEHEARIAEPRPPRDAGNRPRRGGNRAV
jgi:hypothetical protein